MGTTTEQRGSWADLRDWALNETVRRGWLTQRDIYEHTGISHPTWQKIEAGQPVTLATLKKLAHGLDTDLTEVEEIAGATRRLSGRSSWFPQTLSDLLLRIFPPAPTLQTAP